MRNLKDMKHFDFKNETWWKRFKKKLKIFKKESEAHLDLDRDQKKRFYCTNPSAELNDEVCSYLEKESEAEPKTVRIGNIAYIAIDVLEVEYIKREEMRERLKVIQGQLLQHPEIQTGLLSLDKLIDELLGVRAEKGGGTDDD